MKTDNTWKAFWKARIHKNNGTNADTCVACRERKVCSLCQKVYTLSTAFDESMYCSSVCETMADNMINNVRMRRFSNGNLA